MSLPLVNIIDEAYDLDGDIAYTAEGQNIDLLGIMQAAFQINVTDNTPGAGVVVPSASINPTTEEFTATAHGFVTGQVVQISTDTLLPAPLLVLTDYYIIRISANVFKLASTLVNALAGTPIDLTTAGTGNQTVTGNALAASAQMEKSLDGINYFNEGSSQTISGDTVLYFEKLNPSSKYLRIKLTLTGGLLNVNSIILAKGND